MRIHFFFKLSLKIKLTLNQIRLFLRMSHVSNRKQTIFCTPHIEGAERNICLWQLRLMAFHEDCAGGEIFNNKTTPPPLKWGETIKTPSFLREGEVSLPPLPLWPQMTGTRATRATTTTGSRRPLWTNRITNLWS